MTKYDLTNQTFGYLTVVGLSGNYKNRARLWTCLCCCGRTTEVGTFCLLHGKVKSCGCKQFLYKDISGQRHKHLTAIRRTDERDKNGKIIYEWRCDCGNTVYRSIPRSGVSCPECLTKAKKARMSQITKTLNRDEKTGVLPGTVENILKGKVYKNNKSGVRGVCWNKKFNRWEAYGKIDGKYKLLGRFKELEDAKKTREEYVEKNYMKEMISPTQKD